MEEKDEINASNAGDDPFEEVFDLEKNFYEAAFQKGVRESVPSFYREIHRFGVESTFPRFQLLAEIHAHSVVWSFLMRKSSELGNGGLGFGRVLEKFGDDLERLQRPVYWMVSRLGSQSCQNDSQAVYLLDKNLTQGYSKLAYIFSILNHPMPPTIISPLDLPLRSTSLRSEEGKSQVNGTPCTDLNF